LLTINITRRHLVFLVLAFLMIVPLAAYAGSVFDDVDDTDTHIDGITFMKDSGVSVGCDANNNYCPQDNVTRAQMATFMYRLSGNDPATAPSVVAASAAEADSATTADAAATAALAADSDALEGYAASDLVRASFATTGSQGDFGETDPTSIASTSVEAPVDGILLIWGNTNLEWDVDSAAATYARMRMELYVDGADADASYQRVHVEDTLDWDGHTVTMQAAVPVTAGAHTVDIYAERQSGTALAFFWKSDITTLFVPFGNSGDAGTLLSQYTPGGAAADAQSAG
jgi:hypothetical protein